MKLAILTSSRYPPTLGSGARPMRLFEPMSKKHEIHIFYVGQSWITENSDFRDDALWIHTLKPPLTGVPKIGFFSYKISSNYLFNRMKKFGDFDAIYTECNTPRANYALKAAKNFSIPLFSDYADLESYDEGHSKVTYKIYRAITIKILREVFNISKHLFPASYPLKVRFTDFYKIPEERITVIPNGVDSNRFNPAIISGSQIREKFNLLSSTVIGFTGALEPWIRIDILLKAFKEIENDYKDLKLLIVGRGSELDKWKRLSKKLGIENDVIFTGLVPYEEVPEYIASFDVAVSIFSKSSIGNSMSYPLKVMEYMSMEKVSIVDNLPGITLIKNMENGILFEPEDTKSLGNAIRMILDDKNLKRKIEINARKTAVNYDWNALSDKLEETIISKL
jgi:glycosyltransferase involved in cell wall biosynthesis